MAEAATIMGRGRKVQQVLDGAREVFMRDGFEGASVDDIARAAGVSKATLYSYFQDKRHLFMAMAQTECLVMADNAMELIDDARPPREVLTIAASQIVPLLLSEFSQAMFRICVAERDRFPELAHAFYAAGPEMGRRRTIEYLETAQARGELAIGDMVMAAEQFSELCKAKLWNLAAFGVQTTFSQAEIDDVVTNAVETFLARYGV